LNGEAVAPGGLGAVGFDDGVERVVAAGQGDAVDAVAAGRDERGGVLFNQERKLGEGFIEAGPVPAGGDLEAPRAALLPGGISHGGGRPAWGGGAGSRAP
jgi:hypothetical protein